jgi:putative phosphoserine phosphatase / 1-acylglycerol-3-phosphate O-acyltransferase
MSRRSVGVVGLASQTMGRAAVFFDLDRTLLRGASGPVLTAALRQAGVIPDRPIPGENIIYKFFDVVGETLPGMAMARQAANFAKGWSADAVVEAATEAAKVLTGTVQPYARQIMDEHRLAGRPVVLATTSPFDMVKPFADELGLDDVIATRYGRTEEGLYDGSIVGNFVWGPGKLSAVRKWAEEHDVDLKESWFYSDSIYDTPLLAAVGHPNVVNPDPRMRVLAMVRRWPTFHLDVPPGVPKVAGLEPARAVLALTRPEAFPYARFDISGSENIPKTGPAIIVSNHRSYFDIVALGLGVAPSGRLLRTLGKKEVFDAPLVGQLARSMGGIRVERGSGSDAPLFEARRALDAGEVVGILPQGTIPRGEAFYDPELKGRWGAARLAALTGAPIVPIGLWGTERVWPRNRRLPNVLNVTSPPMVTVRVGKPFHVAGEDPEADTNQIMGAIMALLPPESKVRRQPTDEEIRAALPPGAEVVDADREAGRRPGTD